MVYGRLAQRWTWKLLSRFSHLPYCNLLLSNAASEEATQFQENVSTLIKTYLLGVGVFSIITIN